MPSRPVRLLIPMDQLEPHYSESELGPMPVPDALKRQIRQDADRAKAMANESGLDKVGQRVQTNYESKTNGV